MSLREYLHDSQESIISRKADLKNAEMDRQRVEGERKRAMERAAEPFNEQLTGLNDRIAQLQGATLASRLASAPMHETVRQALLLEARIEHGDKNALNDMANEYEQILTHNSPRDAHNRVPRILGRVAQFESLIETLETSTTEVPFVVTDLYWGEVRDVQAEAEGRDSKTGNFVRTGTVLLGRLAMDRVFVRSGLHAQYGYPQAEGIDIIVSGMTHINTSLDNYWYEEKTEVGTAQNAVITVMGTHTGNTIHDKGFEWDLSNDGALPEPEQTHKGVKRDTHHALVWGESADQLLDVITSDPYTQYNMRRAIADRRVDSTV